MVDPYSAVRAISQTVLICPRCGRRHEEMAFYEVSRPTIWTHWATCPITKEPIMRRHGKQVLK